MLRVGMLTSGGDCQALNATMRGVYKAVTNNAKEPVEFYGFEDGYKGLMYGKFRLLNDDDFSNILTVGGTILGTSRVPFKQIHEPDANGLDKVAAMKETYHKLQLNCLVMLGGNGSTKTANLLSEEGLNVITLPKTIDNDLVMTDHTPGYGSTAKYVASTLKEIILDATCYAHPSVTIVELMGRHAGWVTAASVLARTEYSRNPYLIYMPEHAFDMEEFKKSLKAALEQETAVVVCVSEGIADKDGRFICEYADAASVDGFGHKMLTGCGKYLENYVKAEFGIKCRSIELNLPQRCSSLLASATDIDEAEKAGKAAVVAALDGETGKMITFVRDDTNGYEINYGLADVNDICNKEKKFPAEWITAEGTDISDEYIKYVRPLIQGTNIAEYSDGVPVHLKPAYYR